MGSAGRGGRGSGDVAAVRQSGDVAASRGPGEVHQARKPGAVREPGRMVVVSSLSSDAHTWNLVFLQLLIEEAGFEVVNLGPCVPADLLVSACRGLRPPLIVLSSVNGHGHQDGLRAIAALRAHEELATTPVVIGGKLGVGAGDRTAVVKELLAAGFDAVYDDVPDAEEFRGLVGALAAIRS